MYYLFIDVNECDNYGTCDQKCINNAGSYTCSCQSGYNLDDDKKTCKVEGKFLFKFMRAINEFLHLINRILIKRKKIKILKNR